MTGEAEDDEDKPLTDHLRAEEAAPVPVASPPSPSPSSTSSSTKKKKREATAKIANPYTDEPSALMLPIFVAIAACVPFLFCLCKL